MVPDKRQQLMQLIEQLDSQTLEQVIRAFSQTLNEFQEQHVSAEQFQELLNNLSYMPVFTAHPTEAKRRTILECLSRIFIAIKNLDDPRLGQCQKENLTKELSNEEQDIWLSPLLRSINAIAGGMRNTG